MMEVQESAVPEASPRKRPVPPVDPEREKRVAAILSGLDAPDARPLRHEELMDLYDSSFRHISEGEVVRGRVLKILENEVIIDIGYKSEGIVPASEFRGPGGKT